MRGLMVGAALAAMLAGSATAQDAPSGKPQFGAWGYDATGGDPSVKPGDDYFAYANGGWVKSTPIPADKASYGVDGVLFDTAEQRVRDILAADPAGATGPEAQDARKVHAFYTAFMSPPPKGAAPLAADLAAIRAARTRPAIAALMGRQNAGATAGVFDVGIQADLKSPTRYAVYLGQSGLGLPDRDYYLTAQFAAKKAAYQVYVAKMLELAGWADPKGSAAAIVAFETAIAKASWSRAEQRDPDKTYNPMTRAELARYAPGFPWAPFLQAADLGDAKRVVVMPKTAFPKIAAIFAQTPIATLQAWQAFHVVDDTAPYLSSEFVDARFDFRGKTLNGQPELAARWKRAVRAVNTGMGEAVGRVYVAKYFPPEAKAKIDALVGELKVALNRRIDGLDWMSAETKAKAHEKLGQFTVKIAYPDTWRDYSTLEVNDHDLVGDVHAAQAFEWRREVKRINDPVDRAEWGMTPQTVNAYYNPSQNEIVFPAAILQPPYFDPNADPAANYGGIGGVIGHEMTHGFDDEGRKFDGTGKLVSWWTPQDAQKFEAAAKALGTQYDGYSPYPGAHVNGQLTMGENIADLGGILVAFDAYHLSLKGKPAPVIDGLTGDQRFFLAYAQSWRDKEREDALRSQLVSDPHSPEIYRVNGVLRNVDAWYAAAGVKPGDKYYLPPAERVRIW